MPKVYALTNIKYGAPPKRTAEGAWVHDEPVEIAAGDEVKDLPADVLDELQKQGAVGDVPLHSQRLEEEFLLNQMENERLRALLKEQGVDPDEVPDQLEDFVAEAQKQAENPDAEGPDGKPAGTGVKASTAPAAKK
jgi:hypothetical protein